MLEAYSRWILRHPWPVLLGALVVGLITAAGLLRLSFSTDYRVYFSQENPDLAQFNELENEFLRSEAVFFAIAPEDGEVFTHDSLTAIREVTDTGWKLPYARAAYSLTNFMEPVAEEDLISAQPLLPDKPLEQLDLPAVKRRALANARLVGGLLAEAGDVAGVVVYLEMPHKDPERELAAVAQGAQQLVESIRAAHPQLELYQTGVVVFNHALSQTVKWDVAHLYPVAFALMFAVLWLYYRSLPATLATVCVVVLSGFTGMGIAGWIGYQLNPTSAAAGIVILTLAVADCVHILTAFTHYRAEGQERFDALLQSLRENLMPIIMTSLTTAVGFLGMNTSDSPPNRDFGNIVAIGVIAALFYSATFLPALMMLVRLPTPKPWTRTERVMNACAEFVIEHRWPLLIANAVIIVAAAACIPLNEFGDNYVEYFSRKIQFRRDAEFTNERLTGMQLIEYPVPAGEEGGVYEPEYLQRLEAFAQWFKQQPEAKKVTTLTELLKALNRTMYGGAEEQYRLPATRAEAAQFLLFYEMSLPAGVDLTHMVNMDKSSTRVSVTLDTITSEELIALDERAQLWMKDNFTDGMRRPASSISVLFAHIARRNFESMISGTGLSLLVISALLIITLRSVKLGALSLLPNLTPAIIGFGIWGLAVGQVGMSLSIVVSLTLGIVDDDTVHLLTNYQRARRELNLSPADAVRYAFRHVGSALWLMTLVLVLGFTVLMTSAFTLTSDMAALTVLIISIALFADFFFLLPLLMVLDRRELNGVPAAVPAEARVS
ncbi:MAG: efflux RND transporter permease subunit [Nevskiales bacterium]